MYSVLLILRFTPICEVKLKSITQVAKFLDTVNMDIVDVEIITPNNRPLDPYRLLEVWHA